MLGARRVVRDFLPGSAQLYEHIRHLQRKRLSRPLIDSMAASGEPIRLDIGSGGRRGSGGWTTVDTVYGCDLYWDLRDGIPFAPDSVTAIYSSHLFEHLTFTDGQALMRDCYRVLRPGGTFSIVVPDARLYIEGYLGIREIPSEYFGWAPAYNNTTAIDAVNYVAFMGGEHRYLFDQENLIHRLKLAGFTDAHPREFDPEIDMAERDYESIYAEGSKPVIAGRPLSGDSRA